MKWYANRRANICKPLLACKPDRAHSFVKPSPLMEAFMSDQSNYLDNVSKGQSGVAINDDEWSMGADELEKPLKSKRGRKKSGSARRAIEDYYEQKRMSEILDDELYIGYDKAS